MVSIYSHPKKLDVPGRRFLRIPTDQAVRPPLHIGESRIVGCLSGTSSTEFLIWACRHLGYERKVSSNVRSFHGLYHHCAYAHILWVLLQPPQNWVLRPTFSVPHDLNNASQVGFNVLRSSWCRVDFDVDNADEKVRHRRWIVRRL
jgi:hypothetical protein